MTLREKLLQAADDYCRLSGRSKARVATIVARDGKFFDRLEAGGDCTTAMYERFMDFFASEQARREETARAGGAP